MHKTRMKAKYYKEDETMDQKMAMRPDDIPEEEFKELVIYWDAEKTKVCNFLIFICKLYYLFFL